MVRTFVNSGRKMAFVGKFGSLFSVFLLLATLFNFHAGGEEGNGKNLENLEQPLEIQEETIFEETLYRINTSLIVRSGATLVLRNSTVVFEQGNTIPDLLVEYGATLRLENSVIKSNSTKYRFIVHGTLFCENSTILGTWAGENYGGLILNTNSVQIRNSTIGDTEIGLYLPGMGNRTLLVDDAQNETAEKFYFSILSSTGIGFDYWCVEEKGVPTELKNYSVVLWFTGSGARGTLDTTETQLLSAYLNNSGKLILTGQGIGRDINSTYLYSVQLNAAYGGVAGSREILGNGFLENFSGWINARYPLSHGWIITQPENAVLQYGDGRAAGIGVKSEYMVFYTEFSMECLEAETARNLLLKVFDWFGVFVGAPEAVLYHQDFESFNGTGWNFTDGTGNGTWGLSDYKAIGKRSLWCAGNATTEAESIALHESFEVFNGSTDLQPYNGEDAFGLSAYRVAEGNYSLWCAAQGSQWEDEGVYVAFEDFAEFHLKAYDRDMASGLDHWGVVNGKAWCAADGDSRASMNLRNGCYDNFMDAVMYLPVSIPCDFAILSFSLELKLGTGDFLEVGYSSCGKDIAVRKYESDRAGIEKLFISRFAEAVYFRFVSDGSNVSGGAWIDDVEVRGYNYTTYLSTEFGAGLEGWKSYDVDERSGYDTWGVVRRGESFEAWCAASGTQSSLPEPCYSTIYTENFDYGLVNWRNNGTASWTLDTRNLSAPFSAIARISDNSTVFPQTALLETDIDARETRSQKFEFELLFTKASEHTKFFLEVFEGGEWKEVYAQVEECKRWTHCSFVTATPFTAIRCGLRGNGEVYVDNFVVSAIRCVPNTLVWRYDSFMDASLEHEVNFTDWEQVEIGYTLFYNLSERDMLCFEVCRGTWEPLRTYRGALTAGPIPESLSLPLNATALRFRFISDRAGEASGVFIKNIRIYGIKSIPNLEARRAERGMETTFQIPVNLRNYTSAYLSFLLWLDLSSEQSLLLSVENSTSSLLLANYTSGSADQRKWVSQKLDLTDFAGAEILLKFVFLARHYGNLTEGAYIDALRVSGTTTKLYKSNMDARAGFTISLPCKKPWLEFSYLAELATGSSFRVSANSNLLFETVNSTEGWNRLLLSLEEYENLATTITFEFFSATEVSGGVYIDEIRVGGITGYQEGEMVIAGTEIWARKYGIVAEGRVCSLYDVKISAETGLWLNRTNLTAFSLRMNHVEVDARLENSTLHAYNDNLNPPAIQCDRLSAVYSNRSIEVETENTKQQILPEGSDALGNNFTFVLRNNSAIASPRYFVKTGNRLVWYAPYTVRVGPWQARVYLPPVQLPVIGEDMDQDGILNTDENSANMLWLDLSNLQGAEKTNDALAGLYGLNWTFNTEKTSLAVRPCQGPEGTPITFSTSTKLPCLPLSPGTYKLMFRARATDNLTDRIVVNVKLTNNGEIHNSSLGLFYQWYETEPFNVDANSDWEITFTAYSTKLGCTTASYSMFEKAAFLKIADRDGNPTDVRYRRLPSHLVRDCDDDAFPDGSEFPAFMNASAYIEAEFIGGRKKVEENASNGMALWVIKGERVELPIEALNFTNENFDALIRVRARTSDAGTMRLDTGDWEEEVNLTQGYSWYEFRCKLTSTTTLNLTVGGLWVGCDTTSALIDRLNIFDLTSLTSAGAVEGTLIHIANQGTFHIEVPQKAPLCSLSFHITAEPAINRISAKSALVSVTTANETIIWSDVDGAITAFSLSTGNTFTVAKRASIPRNLTASEKILAWEEEISGTRYVCVARLMENAIVHTYSGSMPHVNDNTVVFLTVTRLGTEIHLVRLTDQGFEDVVLAPADGTGDVSYLYWELANPKISGTRILLKASRAGTEVLLLLEFSDFVPAFSGSKFHVSVLRVMNQITGFEIWEEQVVYANGHALSALNLSTGESRFITDSLFVDFKLSGCFLALSRENLSRYGITLYDLATGREKWMGSFSSNPFFLAFSSNLLAYWSPLSMEINYLRSGVSVDVGNDGTIEWLHNGFIVDETTANLLRRPVIFTHAAIYSLPVSIGVSGSATVSEIRASFTTFTDPFLPDTDFDGLSDGVEFESYFPVGIVHLEDALRFQFTEKCENSYLQFGVLLSARPGGHALLALPFDAGESGFYMLSNGKMETINGTFVGEGGELPPNLTEMLSISIIDQGGKEREGNLTWNLGCVHRNSTACFVKAIFTVSASLSAGRYWLEIEIRPVMNLSLILEGKVELSRRGTNFLEPDTDFDGLVDGEEQVMGASPLAPDADHDGIPDSAEIEKGTSALARDTDMDGLRDCAEGNLLFPPQPQPSSYFERLLLFGSPFSYHPLFTSLEIPLMTSPTNPDSDNDGLPDGFIDGWRYYLVSTGSRYGLRPTRRFDSAQRIARRLNPAAQCTASERLLYWK
ncbi:MAG: hypothetical protein QXD15_03630, partial [Thermoplasmata archaeon]